MSASYDIKITLYEPWMLDQILRMIVQEYNFREEDQRRLMRKFYDHPFQRDNSIRIVALDGEKVVGFQSFFYWPYLFEGKPMNTYQSGKSIVDPNYRGRRIFSLLLRYLDEIRENQNIDFLMGFPARTAYNSFIRNKWTNVLNLDWYVKVLNPFSIFRKLDLEKLSLKNVAEYIPCTPTWKGFSLNHDPEFENWRKAYSKNNGYYYFSHADRSSRVQFDLKINLRGRLKELIVGRVRTDSDNIDFLSKAVQGLVKKVRRQHAFSFMSVALNGRYFKPEILKAFRQLGFRRINKEIFFIVKGYMAGEEIYKPELWELYKSDIDTW